MKKTDVCTCIEQRLLKRKRSVTSYATSSTVPLAVTLSTRDAGLGRQARIPRELREIRRLLKEHEEKSRE